MFCARFIIITLLFFIQGCASVEPSIPLHAYIANGVKLNFLNLELLSKRTSANQLLKIKYKQKSYSLNVVTQFLPSKIKVIGLTKFGSRIFMLEYGNNSLNFTHSKILPAAKKIRPEYIFADMQLIYWPLDEIKENLTGNIKVAESGFKRVFSKGNNPVIEIYYNNKDKWQSDITYKHLERKYEYTIENL